ncbi:MAG TPA: hypothetical protein VLE02_02695 [Nitrosarchaeum sp.]|nr:hypothetical protein [Nitrosarchaeum sp.]
MLSKSWKLTLFLYSFSLMTILLEVFTGITISEQNTMLLLSLVGISTTAGTTNAVLSNKEAIKKIILEITGLKKPEEK